MKNKSNRGWLLLSLSGIILFVCLYVTATLLYPGGSQADKNATGFSWAQNYWCNLLNEKGINGRHNPGRPFAITGMLVIAVTLAIFWYIFPVCASLNKCLRLTTQISGTLAMAAGVFISTGFHDRVIIVAGLFGLVAIGGTFAGLLKLKWMNLFRLGVFCTILVGVNNLLYYGLGLLYYLPVVQKITFFFFLMWIVLIHIGLMKLNVTCRK